LQEVIAPHKMEFFNSVWHCIGSKGSLCGKLSSITGISVDILTKRESLARIHVAEKMKWASKRETTRIEDIAYCLLSVNVIKQMVRH